MDVLLTSRDLPVAGQDVQLIDGAPLSAQNIVETLFTPLGSLPWDRTAGSTFTTFLNSLIRQPEIIAEIERVAEKTPGVLPQSVRATYNELNQQYRLVFTAEDTGTLVAIVLQEETITHAPSSRRDYGLLLIAPGEYLLVGPEGGRLRV